MVFTRLKCCKEGAEGETVLEKMVMQTVYVCMYVCMYICLYAFRYVSVCIYLCVSMYACMSVDYMLKNSHISNTANTCQECEIVCEEV